MFNNERPRHEYFEELCALAATGQISETEFVELQDHIQQCVGCRSAHADFIDLLHTRLPLADPGMNDSFRLSDVLSRSSPYHERFFARARKQGLPVGFSQNKSGSKVGFLLWRRLDRPLTLLAMGLLLTVAGILGYSLRQSNVRYQELKAKMNAPGPDYSDGANSTDLIKARNDHAAAEARSEVLANQLQKAVFDLGALRARQQETSDSRNQLEKTLMEVQQSLKGVNDDLEKQLQAAVSALQNSRAQDEQTSDARKQLERELAQAREDLKRVNDELQTTRRERDREHPLMIATQLDNERLSKNLTEQTAALEEYRQFRPIRDLLGEPNLHMSDAIDVDSKSRDKQHGRALYTRNSLAFYAYDLGDRVDPKRNVSFQVWGIGDSDKGPAKSLGILHKDEQKQNIWVLTVSGSQIMSGIDGVFVTVEPPGGSTRPSAQRLVYVFIDAD